MSLPRKPSQGREMQFTTDFPPLPKDSAALEGWYRDLKTRLKSDQQTVEDAFAKLREQIGDASTATQLAAMEARLLALETNPFVMPLIFDRHVSTLAAIVESKIALNFPTHSNANDPTTEQKAALAGTQGLPSDMNRFVTNQDTRLVTPDTGSALVLASMVREGARPLDETAEILLHLIRQGSIPRDEAAEILLAMEGGKLMASPFIRTLLDDIDAAAARATLGVTNSGAMLLFRQEELDTVSAGTFTSGSWVTVPINTERVDTGNNGSIAGNAFTLAAGTYRYRYGVIGYAVEQFQGRLFNVDDTAVIADSYGSVVVADGGAAVASAISHGVGRFTLAASKALRLEAQCNTTAATTGFGSAGNFGVGEVYSWISFERE